MWVVDGAKLARDVRRGVGVREIDPTAREGIDVGRLVVVRPRACDVADADVVAKYINDVGTRR